MERFVDDIWYTNIHDLKAKVDVTNENDVINFNVIANLTNREKEVIANDSEIQFEYIFDKEKTTIKVERNGATESRDTLISPTGEKVVQPSDYIIEFIRKKEWLRLNLPFQ